MGGGGGDTDVMMRSWKGEQPSIRQGYKFQTNQLNKFGREQPLLKAAQEGVLGFWDQLPGMLSQLTGFGKELTGYQNQLSALQGDYGKFLGPKSALSSAYGATVAPVLRSGGALTPEGLRTSQQQARLAASASGTNRDIGANVNEVLNNEANRQARFQQALAQSQSILGQQSGASGLVAGLLGQRAGLTGQKAGLLGQRQGLQTGATNQLLGVENALVGNFTGLTNPILGYLGNLFSGNQQASIAQAQIAAQQEAAGQGKMGSAAGGALSAFGSIAAAY